MLLSTACVRACVLHVCVCIIRVYMYTVRARVCACVCIVSATGPVACW